MVVRKHFDWATLLANEAGVRVTTNSIVYGSGKGRIQLNKDYMTIIKAASGMLQKLRPMTVRQVYYALFSAQFIHNSKEDYRQVVMALVQGRKLGFIPWEWIEDRTRRPRTKGQWDDLTDYLKAVERSYMRDVWQNQSQTYFEFWVEKDALSGIFQDICDEFGITLNVGRGYDGWSSIKNAAERFKARQEQGMETVIFYYGDFDASGKDMPRSLHQRLKELGVEVEVRERAITEEDIFEYDLPPEPGKPKDARRDWFKKTFPEVFAKYGDVVQIELDALPVDVLRARIREDIEAHLDLDDFQVRHVLQEEDREVLVGFIQKLQKGGDDMDPRKPTAPPSEEDSDDDDDDDN